MTARHVGGDVVDLVEDPAGTLDDPSAVLGQPALGAVDERDAEFLLEAGDVAGDVRLHRVERAGGRRECSVVGNRHQRRQLSNIHLWER